MTPEKLTDTVTLYQGDCLDVLPLLEPGSVDAVITDPPYGMNWDTDTTRFSGGHNPARRGVGRNDGRRVANDDKPFDPRPWLGFPKVAMFGANHFAGSLPVGTWLVWIKKNDEAFGSFLSDAELAWVKGGYGVYCHRDLSANAEAKERRHPTQKPLKLMRWMIRRLTAPGDTVLDPFAGSGTTLVACALEGRKCIGVEIDPGHCETIRRRIDEVYQRTPGSLFAEVPA